MLDVKYVLRGKGSLSLLVNEHLLHDSSSSSNATLENFDNGESSPSSPGDLRLSMTELSTALSVRSVSFPSLSEKLRAAKGLGSMSSNKLCASTDLLLYSDPITNTHAVYFLTTGQCLGTTKRPATLSDKTQKLVSVTAAEVSGREGLFFCLCEDDSLYAVIAQTQETNNTKPGYQKVRASPVFRLESKALKKAAKIQSLHSHPCLPLLFSLHADGAVYVSFTFNPPYYHHIILLSLLGLVIRITLSQTRF